jgi:hypothetical protein
MTISLAPRFAAFLKMVAATGWFSAGLAPITTMASEFLHALKRAQTTPKPMPANAEEPPRATQRFARKTRRLSEIHPDPPAWKCSRPSQLFDYDINQAVKNLARPARPPAPPHVPSNPNV